MKTLKVLSELSFIPGILAVGGCVRDELLGRDRDHDDVDVASPVLPFDLMTKCRAQGLKTIPVGIDHGTVIVVLPDGTEVEHTTFRKDVAADGRHAEVEFADTFREDAQRRDFTINAMGMTPDGEIVDPFLGKWDLNGELVRTVGAPRKRFEEDYLRIIRMARFAGRYSFEVDSSTWGAAKELAPRILSHVSIERVVQEINKAFSDEAPSRFFLHLLNAGVLQHILPSVYHLDSCPQNPRHHPEGNAFVHTLEVIDRAPQKKKRQGWQVHRWTALFHDIGKPIAMDRKQGQAYPSYHGHDKEGETKIEGLAKHLKLPNWLRDHMMVCTRHHMRPLMLSQSGVTGRARRRFQRDVGEYLEDLRILHKADKGEVLTPELFEPVEEPTKPILMGRHLIDDGYEPGPQFGPMLDAAFEAQIENGITDKDELLAIARQAN